MTEWINNLYLINTILNICSTTFTLLFLLYRFTSLFSYIIGFIKFCGKLFNGIIYLKNLTVDYYYNRTSQITEDTTYTIDAEHGLNESSDHYYTSDGFVFRSVYSNETFFNKIKRKAYNLYHYIYPKKNEYNVIPIYETRTSYIDDQLAGNNGNNCISNITNTQIEKNLIIDHINNLLDEENESSSSVPLLWFDQQSPDSSCNYQHNLQTNPYYDPLGNFVINGRTDNQIDYLNTEYNNYYNNRFNNHYNNYNNHSNNHYNNNKDYNNSGNNFNNNTVATTNIGIVSNPNLIKNNITIGTALDLSRMSDCGESDYKSECKSDYSNHSNANDLINKFQNLSLKLN
jgi:hypothetical protein